MKNTPLTTLCIAFAVSSLLGLEANAAVYSQNFNFANGTTNFGDGSTLTTNGAAPASVQNNALQLTTSGVGSAQNSLNIPALAGSALGFSVSFDIQLAALNGTPADGFSFNYGNFSAAANYGEEGPGQGLSWVVDTYNNANDQGYRLKINGANAAGGVITTFPIVDGQTISGQVTLSWSPVNGMSMSFLGDTLFTNIPTPGFVGDNSFIFGIGARTGGATETARFDNLLITTVPEPAGLLSLLGVAIAGFLRRRR